jgi:predicted Zn-dependent protease
MKALFTVLFVLALSVGTFPQNAAPARAVPAYVPPTPRTKALTLFAPKPLKGDNIFKGEAEAWLADAITSGMNLTPIKDQEIADYVEQMGQNLVKYSTAPKKKFHFIVLDDDSVNAFSVGDGRIYINLGAIKDVRYEDELAALLAHEIGHDAFMHAPKMVTRQLFWMTGKRKVLNVADVEKALDDLEAAYRRHDFAAFGENLLGWSRFAELEADKAGFYNMYKAGYNPESMKDVFRRFVAEDKAETGDRYKKQYLYELLFGSHPPSSQRLTAIKWESNWVKMPPKESHYDSPSFGEIKERLAKL